MRIIAYMRVSTKRQGQSGLGLQAQQYTLDQYVKSAGCCNIGPHFKKVVRTKDGQEHILEGQGYLEVETGKMAERPELANALAHARRAQCSVVVAKLDRLARNARFLLGIIESGADVIFCDLPMIQSSSTGKFILTQMAAVAELEAGMISDRTKAALAAYRARGGRLGAELPQCRNLTAEAGSRGRMRSAEVRVRSARKAVEELAPVVLELRSQGLTLEQIAWKLNDRGYVSRWGKPWTRPLVGHLLKRCPTTGISA